jgi:Protein of unknown function (DUF3307)
MRSKGGWQGRAKLLMAGPMDNTLLAPLLLIGLLQVKHMICDGPLQTLRMVQDKSIYGRPMGLLHALIHVIGSALVYVMFGIGPSVMAYLLLLEFAIHYHIDYTKENIVKAMKWTTSDGPYWWAITTDQGLHHMSYLLLAWLAVKP